MKRTFLKLIVLICGGLTITLQGCEWFTRRNFYFQGTYLAPQSGYQMEIVVQGVRDMGEQSIVDIYHLAQICPIQPNTGRSIRFRINSKREAGRTFLIVDNGTPLGFDWQSSPGMLRSLLQQSGFTELNQKELERTQQILTSAQPAYAMEMEGVKVKRADLNAADSAQPPSDLPPCPS